MILKTVVFKNRICCQDFREKKLRKILNFGHTIGHALESLSMATDKNTLLHGDAVALGMIAETWLSHMKAGLSETEAIGIISFLRAGYQAQADVVKDSFKITGSSYDSIYDLLLHDKKNKDGQILFTLLQAAGKPRVSLRAGREEIITALDNLFE